MPLQAGESALDFYPAGIILAWASKEPAPKGWADCDGTNGTPDLRDKFLMGGEAAAVRNTGGSAKHGHKVFKDGGRDGRGFEVEGECGLGDADEREHLPPYVVVRYIMKT